MNARLAAGRAHLGGGGERQCPRLQEWKREQVAALISKQHRALQSCMPAPPAHVQMLALLPS